MAKKTIIQSVKGTRDFYPGDMAIRIWLYDMVRKVSESFGYQEWEGPILEKLELYAAKSSEELAMKQSYVFPDRSDEMIMLRPELTPSLARVIAQRQRQLTYPLRWWSFGPFWRYEAPQKGRSREFFQWNIDQIGVDTPEADAEMVAIVAGLFREVGLTSTDATIQVNDRQLVNREIEKLGITPQQHQAVLNWIDRRAKMKPVAWNAYGTKIGLSLAQIEQTNAFLHNDDLWKESETLVRVFEILEAMGVAEYVKYDSSTIRGLPYYTGIVFEAFDVRGSVKRSILGGGRYNNLMEAVGGDPMPAVGFAMGDLVITLILEELGLLPQNVEDSPAPVLVTIFDESTTAASFEVATELREAGLNVAIYPAVDKLGKQFKYAGRIGAKVALVLGPDEIENNQIAVKDLTTRGQENIDRGSVLETIKKILAGANSP
jgi:histidyl-tRNA synthetase